MWRYDKRAVGARIRAQRKALDLTQDELAERIGRSTKFCADLERGYTGMSIDTMLSICQALKLSPNLLLLGENGVQDQSLTSAEDMLARCTPAQRALACEMLRILFQAYA